MKRKTNLFIERMIDKNLSLALAESMTCGLAAHTLSNTKGTSEVLRGSVVCYHEDVKKELLNIPSALIEKHSAESMQVTEALARNLRKLIAADVHAAITGLASAGGSETKTKPPGTVFFCVLYKNKVFKLRKLFRGSPLQIRDKACYALLDFISKKILLS